VLEIKVCDDLGVFVWGAVVDGFGVGRCKEEGGGIVDEIA
jgi:hypothetical protein